jgi:DNA-binding NarL/FixJ family response regulator
MPINQLTPQEISIAVLVSEGKTNSEIGSSLFIASGTVRNYVSVILSKLYLPNRAALAVYAVQNNLRGQAIEAYQAPETPTDPDCYHDLLFNVYA